MFAKGRRKKIGSGPPIDPHPTGSLSVEEGRAAHTEPFPCAGSPARCLTSVLFHLHDSPVRWLLMSRFTDEETEAQGSWPAKIRESREGQEAVLSGAFVTHCVLYIFLL